MLQGPGRWICEIMQVYHHHFIVGNQRISVFSQVGTIVTYLKEVESPYAVLDFIRSYLGDTLEAKEFAKQFLERRAKQKANQQRQQQQVDVLSSCIVSSTSGKMGLAG